MADDDARGQLNRLRGPKGLDSFSRVSEALYRLADEIDALAERIKEIERSIARLSSDADKVHDRLWSFNTGRKLNGGNEPSGIAFVRLGLMVVGMGFVVLLMLIAFASPATMELLMLILGEAP